ncbi:unnamed protein product [Peronospora belbahrii]|uniref:Uncharacterized protein n=1 Tax=Peronospora belbahrii TaxID=622444 RepID=A0AAU9KNM9_9STRA|nr:unnamed protein product [Peronospora belbahrii]CAH0518617.1 unnamed protein product [Peronospora belbahrii]
MTRFQIALAVLLGFAGFAATEGIDWTFWNDDDDDKDDFVPDSSKTMPPTTTMTSGNSHDKSVVKSTFRNWVGPWSMSPDTACYREAHIMDVCPDNYDRNELTNTCWTECPVQYPVECGMECIRQNDDCGLEVSSKVSAVAMTIFSSATFGVFGELSKLGKTISRAVQCTNSLMLVMRGVVRYIRTMKTEDPQASDRKLLILLYQTGTVVTDLPIAITVCLGKAVPPNLRKTQYFVATVQWMLMQAIAHDDSIISNWKKFKGFLTGANFTEAAEEITENEISSLETAMKQNSTCGGDLTSLTGRVWTTVNGYREDNPGITDDEIRLRISNSDLVKYDVPTATNNCMPQMVSESNIETAYHTRETLRKTFGVIINDLIKSRKSDNGTSLEDKERAYKVIDMAFSTLAATLIDPTRITLLLSEFIQTICGPTQFMGEIDDGKKAATLGLNTLGDAFKGSNSVWTKKGDGVVIINFASTDNKDVTVNIKSGGDKVVKVDVRAGGTVEWKSHVAKLGGKTLYLDRWRPGFLGLPGTGGGSLSLWVPKASQGGHLELDVKINVS